MPPLTWQILNTLANLQLNGQTLYNGFIVVQGHIQIFLLFSKSTSLSWKTLKRWLKREIRI